MKQNAKYLTIPPAYTGNNQVRCLVVKMFFASGASSNNNKTNNNTNNNSEEEEELIVNYGKSGTEVLVIFNIKCALKIVLNSF